ncbi:MAG: type I-B CRISPR-associated protein Cas7/Csh2 [Thermosphaera sp.]
MRGSNPIDKNSEILFVYEARLCNPNGDPDRENKPRIDPVTWRNYVTDVRLKRFFRDYIIERMGEKYIWVTTINGENVRADKRLEISKQEWKYRTPLDLTKYHIDARLFGATIPIGEKKRKETGKGENGEGKDQTTKGGEEQKEGEPATHQIIGPVQFSIGYSLHKVETMSEVSAITSRFVGAERKGERQYGTIGRDWRVYYSLIAFYGTVSSRRARVTGLRESDIYLLDNILWEAVHKKSVTRSKIGHFPHLYLRIQYKDGDTLFGDLRKFIIEDFNTENVRDLKNINLLFDNLFNFLEKNKDRIDSIFIRESDEFAERFKFVENIKSRGLRLIHLPHENVELSEDILIVK